MADGKWIEGLTPGMPAAEAAKLVLAARFAVVRNALPRAVETAHDPEHVHQLRVGTRRAGAALRAFADCLPPKRLKQAKRHLRTIRRAAGDARDWDVFLHRLPKAEPLSGESGKPAFDFLAGYAMGERAAAQVRLVTATAAAGPGFAEVSAELPAKARDRGSDDTPTTFGELAGTRFGEQLREFTAAVEADPTDPAGLHQLRIRAKRVRYSLELFAGCFPPVFRGAMYPAVERVQEVLGGVQDAVVARDRLTDLRHRVRAVLPDEWPRLEPGFEGLIGEAEAAIPAGREAFAEWRKEWLDLVVGLKLEVVAAMAAG